MQTYHGMFGTELYVCSAKFHIGRVVGEWASHLLRSGTPVIYRPGLRGSLPPRGPSRD